MRLCQQAVFITFSTSPSVPLAAFLHAVATKETELDGRASCLQHTVLTPWFGGRAEQL